MAKRSKVSPSQIEKLYDSGEFRLSQEKMDFILPQIRDFVSEKRWLNLRPEYQRRLVWDRKKKSRFIESLLMNVPIPPVFLYEFDLNQYEVMDGQQRLNSILEFYDNRFALQGLETWSVLNGRTYAKCPPRIQRGLDRRRLSANVLLAESARSDEEREMIRRQVFERLNTGGQPLNAQELRNAMYGGPFNDLLIELAGNRRFNELWGIPPYEEHYSPDEGYISPELASNKYFQRMRDCELVLRFVAFRRTSKVRGSVRKILDDCMKEHQMAAGEVLDDLRDRFGENLETAYAIFKQRTFQVKDEKRRWRLSIALFDAVMVALDRHRECHDELIGDRKGIVEALEEALEDEETYEIVTGKPNTAKAIKERIDGIYNLLAEFV